MTIKITTTMTKTIRMTVIIKISLITMMTKSTRLVIIMMVLAVCHIILYLYQVSKNPIESIGCELPRLSLSFNFH